MKIRVKPSGGNVLDERGNPYPNKVFDIEKTVYVARLVRDGSLVVQSQKAKEAGGDK